MGPNPLEQNGICEGSDRIINMNVRGKRGNIVQVYPSVEYDFVPNKLTVNEDECLHIQWTGSDYNPNRNPNNGEGGPPNPNNQNEGKSDRTNIVQMALERNNFPVLSQEKFTMFKASENQWKRMTFNDQPVGTEGCKTATQLQQLGVNNRQARERDHRNCGKLSGQKIPHMDIGLVKPGTPGRYTYMSTRNNNFSNRGQKGEITIEKSKRLGGGAVAAIVLSSLAVVGAAGFVGFKKVNNEGNILTSFLPAAKGGASGSKGKSSYQPEAKFITNNGSSSQKKAVAKHSYSAQEPGELSFKKGEEITILSKDSSGWWEGKTKSGQTGVLPSNYVTLK